MHFKISTLLVLSFVTAFPPQQATSLPWTEATLKAKQVVSTLSLEDKVALMSGVGWGGIPEIGSPCVGNIKKIDAIPGFEGLCLQDGPAGVRFSAVGTASVFTSAVNVAATFDKELMYANGRAQGEEFYGKGINIALTPAMNMGRVAKGGRNWEAFGEDPYLTSVASSQSVKGLQSTGVIATAKHFFGNEQEHFREGGYSKIDDRALREIYLPPFKASIEAGVGAIMCAYNNIVTSNGENNYACEHDTAINQILKKEMGFNGIVMSDWWASHNASVAANNGLDMMMAGDEGWANPKPLWGPALVKLVKENEVKESRITDAATRILATWYKLGQNNGFPKTNFDSFRPSQDQNVTVRSNHAATIRKIGAASTILLKNVKNALPLKQTESIIVIGDNARAAKDPNAFADRGGVDGHVALGWGSGTANYPYLVGPLDAFKTRGVKHKYFDSNSSSIGTSASDSTAAVVFVYANSGEAFITVQNNAGDRNDLKLWDNGDDLIIRVAAQYKRTIVVITAPGPVDMAAWIDLPNVAAVVLALFPGQESGNAIADVLYGNVNPSGRLPFTIALNEEDYCCKIVTEKPGNVDYTESIFMGYRWFDQNNKKPLFPFGFGLSYTTFEYSNLKVVEGSDSGSSSHSYNDHTTKSYGNSVVSLSLNLKNTGSLSGAEIVQLYIGLPESTKSAPLNLKGFEKVMLSQGGSDTVKFSLTREDLSFWDISTKNWVLANGTYKVFVGSSSRDVKLQTTFTI